MLCMLRIWSGSGATDSRNQACGCNSHNLVRLDAYSLLAHFLGDSNGTPGAQLNAARNLVGICFLVETLEAIDVEQGTHIRQNRPRHEGVIGDTHRAEAAFLVEQRSVREFLQVVCAYRVAKNLRFFRVRRVGEVVLFRVRRLTSWLPLHGPVRWRAGLLYNVGEFVREQSLSAGRPRSELSLGKHNFASHGVGAGAQGPRRSIRDGARMNAHPGKIAAELRFHKRARRRIKRVAG